MSQSNLQNLPFVSPIFQPLPAPISSLRTYLLPIHGPCANQPLTFTDKATWMGCGQHVPNVMDAIPQDQWCTCEPKVEKKGQQYPPAGSVLSACGVM